MVGDTILMSTERPYHKANMLQVSRKSLLSLILYTFLDMYNIVPGPGANNPLGTKFDVNRKALSLCPFVASFNKISLTSDFIHILNDLTHVYSIKAVTDNPLETNFYVTRKALSLCPFVASLKKNLIEVLILYTFFKDLI